MSSSKAIGIDLGTTYSCVAICDDEGKTRVLKNPDGNTTTPSVIYFTGPDTPPLVGSEAKAMMALGEMEGVDFFKREMGNSSFSFEAFNKKYTAKDLSAILLAYLKEYAEDELGEKVENAIITVPAYFDDAGRNMTIQAAEQAGLKVLEIINEPTSAAIAFGLNQDSSTNQTILVYDLGGGTFDVSVVRITGHDIQVIATAGDHHLGGKDWDTKLLEYVASKFMEDFGANLLEDQVAINETKVKCEKLKKELSQVETSKIRITYEGNTQSYTVTREQFEQMTSDLMNQTEVLCEKVLVDTMKKPLRWSDIDGVLLVGGSTRMPMVSKLVERLSGKAPMKKVNVDEAVAIGAAIRAKIRLSNNLGLALPTTKKSAGAAALGLIKIRDVTGHSLGMVAENRDRSAYINQILIPKNTEIPAVNKQVVQLRIPSRGGETEVYMLQGEVSIPYHCTILGKYVFSGIEREKKDKPDVKIEISYIYNQNGVVEVEATQPALNKKLILRKEPVPDDMEWLTLPPPKEQILEDVEDIAVVLAIDGSGSMSGSPLHEATKAGLALVKDIGFEHCFYGIVGFGSNLERLLSLTNKQSQVEDAIKAFPQLYLGGTSAIPFNEAVDVIGKFQGKKFIVLLTDGYWAFPDQAIQDAKHAKSLGIEIFAVGIEGADWDFLKKIASTDTGAIMADVSKLTETFSKIGQVMTGSSSLSKKWF